MKNRIDGRLLSEEILMLIFKQNSDSALLKALSPETINAMCDLHGVSKDDAVDDKLRHIRQKLPKHSQVLDSFCKTHIIDNISASLRQMGSTVIFQLVRDGRIIWTAGMGLMHEHDYEIINLGSGRNDHGIYYISVAVVRDHKYVSKAALKVDRDNISIENKGSWRLPASVNYLVFDEDRGYFVEKRYRDLPLSTL